MSNAFAGTHKDKYGKFQVFFTIGDGDGCPGGWYWAVYDPEGALTLEDAIGPYTSSQEAWQAATDLDYSINHRIGK